MHCAHTAWNVSQSQPDTSRGGIGCVLLLLAAASGCGDDAPVGGAGGAGAGGAGGATAGGGGEGGAGLVCDAPFISKGPWSLRMASTSIAVRWEACAPDADPDLVFEPEAGGETRTVSANVETFVLDKTYQAGLSSIAPPDYAGTYYIHEAELTELQPGTCYRYHLAADEQRKGRFCTARPDGEPFVFVAIGDTNPGLGSTADTLKHAFDDNPDFTIHGGDIQYYDSLLETWAYWFPIMQPMLSQGAFLPAIGNHESEVEDELSDYALRFFGNAGFGGAETYYGFESGGVAFFNLNTEEPISQGSPQAIWLQEQLENAALEPGHRFSVVYFHRPLLTCGDSGDDPAGYAHLEPVFEANKVLFVIQAHMHGYERFEIPNGPTYITTAGGGGLIQNIDENIDRPYCDQRVASAPVYHTTVFHVGQTEVVGEVIDRDGVVQDTFTRTVP